MTPKFTYYSDMVMSGQQWLGDVPAHWELLPLRSIFQEIKDQGHEAEELLSVTISRGVIRQSDLLASTSKKDSSNLDKSKYKLVFPGDIAYNKMRAWQGAIGVSAHKGIVSPAYVIQRLRGEGLPEYFHHLFRTPAFATEAERWSYGITSDQWSLRPEHFKLIYACVPPQEEQALIVRFISELDRRVNRFIENKLHFIRLLGERRDAAIQAAITRGVEPAESLRSTEWEWLSKVPAGWTTKRLKFVVKITSGQVDPRTPEYRDQLLIAPNHIESGTGELIAQETADQQGADSGKYVVKAGQVIYSKIRPNLRKATIAPTDGLCSADMYPLEPRSNDLSPEYLLLLMLSGPVSQYTVDCSLRVAMPKVNRDALGDCLLWYPSREEQEQILTFVKAERHRATQAIERARREVELVREYRARYVADVVTGKLDVRAAAGSLPDVSLHELDALEKSLIGSDPDEVMEADEPVSEEIAI